MPYIKEILLSSIELYHDKSVTFSTGIWIKSSFKLKTIKFLKTTNVHFAYFLFPLSESNSIVVRFVIRNDVLVRCD